VPKQSRESRAAVDRFVASLLAMTNRGGTRAALRSARLAHPTGPHRNTAQTGTHSPGERYLLREGCEEKESVMPMIFFLWAIPAVIVIGGGTYWLMHVH
jgi:hypothetical protein